MVLRLQNGDDWLVLDPKGVIGEEAFEVAAFIRNPMPELLNHVDAPNIIHNRITRFAELLELPSQRILDWCFVQAVLAIHRLRPALYARDPVKTGIFWMPRTSRGT